MDKISRNAHLSTSVMRGNDERDDDGVLWRIVTDHPDVFDAHVVTKLNGNDVKFFYDVNSESRRAIQRSKVRLPNAFKIEDFDTTRPYLGLWRSVLKRRNGFVGDWLEKET